MFCALLALGKEGYAEIIGRNVAFARRIAEWMHTGPGSKYYTVLNANTGSVKGTVDLNIILFRAKSDCGVDAYAGNGSGVLVSAINDTRDMYVTPSSGSDGVGAIRLAVSNWMTGREGGNDDFGIVVGVLEGVMVRPPAYALP